MRPTSPTAAPPRARLSPWLPAALAGALLLASCENTGGVSSGGLRNDYLVARQALETGNYDLAIRRYRAALHRTGAADGSSHGGSHGRLRLEYAHSLLRANRFDEAIAQADLLAGHAEGSVRSSALAVRGTARHELARQSGDPRGAEARDLLTGARADLAAFLQAHPGLDAAEAMQRRLDLVQADLARAGG